MKKRHLNIFFWGILFFVSVSFGAKFFEDITATGDITAQGKLDVALDSKMDGSFCQPASISACFDLSVQETSADISKSILSIFFIVVLINNFYFESDSNSPNYAIGR